MLDLRDEKLPALLIVAPGIYLHYKGLRYQVVDTVRHSETLEPMTLYRALYGDGGLWVRPASMFLETVDTPSGPQPRFKLE